jgi:hypothetical protein
MGAEQLPESHEENAGFELASRALSWGERGVFAVVGVLLFLGALALAWHAFGSLIALFTGSSDTAIDTAARFINLILLIMMIAEIGYTVTLSVRGRGLTPQPFLIVGLIAVIRRILVITVQDVRPAAVGSGVWVTKSTVDLAILTLVVLVFVTALVLLRARPVERPR